MFLFHCLLTFFWLILERWEKGLTNEMRRIVGLKDYYLNPISAALLNQSILKAILPTQEKATDQSNNKQEQLYHSHDTLTTHKSGWNGKEPMLINWTSDIYLEKSRDSKIRRLFEFREEKWFSIFLVSGLRKLINFGGQMTLRMKLIAKKELNLLFQMTPSRILCDR